MKETETDTDTLKDRLLLLVDDDPVDRMAVRRALAKAGIEATVREEADVEGALRALGEAAPDVALLDYMLPSGDALDVMRRAREAGVQTPFIVLTGRGDEEAAVNLMRAGAADYIPKSALAPLRLAMSVHGAIARHGLQRECAELLVREREAFRQAEAASRAKDDFLAMVSHDLRTPLSAILNWARVLLAPGGAGSANLTRGLEAIERSAKVQSRLIEDLLDINRIAQAKLRLDDRPVEPLVLAHAALDTLRPAAEAKGVRLAEELDRSAGVIVGDPDRLQQVFWNILSNAIKFTPRDGLVTLRVRRLPERLEISVADTGCGISPDLLPRLFHRFQQGHGEERRGGLGLGLAIARHIVELHGGTVRCESPGPGQGSTFTVELPIG